MVGGDGCGDWDDEGERGVGVVIRMDRHAIRHRAHEKGAVSRL